MPLWIHILAALILDAVCGDPRRWPHPVQAIGHTAQRLEVPLRRHLDDDFRAGLVTVVVIVGGSALVIAGLIHGAAAIHPLLGDGLAIIILYTTFAGRSLSDHARAVQQPLLQRDLPAARVQIARLVGRDTDQLGEAEISRATVESVAENTVDGVTAPLLFAVVGGPVAAMVYKAINTLDSTFGYKNERYVHFGRAAARLDDAANFIPARLTALISIPAAALAGLDARNAWRILRRDRHNHPSPNGGQIESAFSGALHVRLGGENHYFGRPSFRPYLGDADQTLSAWHISAALRLMIWTTVLITVFGLVGRSLFTAFCSGSFTP